VLVVNVDLQGEVENGVVHKLVITDDNLAGATPLRG
jgi:hypothetical protein